MILLLLTHCTRFLNTVSSIAALERKMSGWYVYALYKNSMERRLCSSIPILFPPYTSAAASYSLYTLHVYVNRHLEISSC
jgi:hypothetical protein